MLLRTVAAGAFLATLAISGAFRSRARRASGTIERRREGVLLMSCRALVAVPLFASTLLYLANPAWMAWSSVGLPTWLRAVGALLTVSAVPAAWWVFRTLGHNVSETVLTKSTHQLVTSGPYQWVRHPLYLTGSMLFTGIGLIASNWFILLFALGAIAGIRGVVIPLEERALAAKFGAAYEQYASRTGGLLPRLARPNR
jgi:protein-S-isoprenylcysteine O-methyltransferase Ste14